jgi:selenocysteine-specific elongation factor
MTIGGGVILDGFPAKHKRLDERTLEGMKRLEGDRRSIVEQMFWKSRFFPQGVADVALKLGEKESALEGSVQILASENRIVPVRAKDTDPQKKQQYLHKQSCDVFEGLIIKNLEGFLGQNPSALEMPLAELRSKLLKLTDAKTFGAIVDSLQDTGRLYQKGSSIGIAGYKPSLSPQEMTLMEKVEETYQRTGFISPLEEDVRNDLGIEEKKFQKIMTSLVAQKKLYRLSDKVTYHQDTIHELKNFVVEYIERKGRIKLSDLRDELQFSRKYAQAILEHFDEIGLTKRIEDYRVSGS